ncbi:MAG: hypothetical protein ABI837_16865 [Acidobacteriota bacterium]
MTSIDLTVVRPTMVAAGILVALLSSCARERPALAHARVATSAEVAIVPPKPVTQRPVWSVRLLTTGGFGGTGKGRISLGSDGRVEAISDCAAPLSEEARRAIGDAVSAAHPQSWKSTYALRDWSGMTDQFRYSLSLSVGEAAGKEVTYPASWSAESFALLPADLRRLHDTLWAAHEELSGKCQALRAFAGRRIIGDHGVTRPLGSSELPEEEKPPAMRPGSRSSVVSGALTFADAPHSDLRASAGTERMVYRHSVPAGHEAGGRE